MGLPQDVIERTVEEFVAAIRAGMTPSLESFCRRHQHDDELRKVLLAAKMIELAKVPAAPGPGPSQSQMTIPPRLDGYRLISEIGKGGMGVVYRAEDETLGRHVALKVISPEFLHQNGRATVARFAVEAKIEANLQHSNIVQIYGFGRDQGIHYISMQLVDGLPLSEVWKQLSSARTPEATEQQPTEPSQTPETATAAVEITRMLLNGSFTRGADHTSSVEHLRILDEASSSNGTISKAGPRSREYVCKIAGIGAQVADALQYAHQRGITHRDIKPGNLLLDPTGNVWVADFGLACRKNLNPPTAGAMEGSLRYMAPEQFFGESDARSDIYSLGITLHELLTLERSFEAATVSELKAVIRRQELKVPVDRVRIPADLRSIIRKSIAPDASRRYSSARELKTDLERFLEGVPVQARKLNFVERTYRWCKRRPVQALAVCLLLTVCILASAVASVSTIAARTQKELREDAERLRYLSEIGVTFLQYQELLGDSQSPAVTEYSARSRLNDGAVYSPRLAPASVSSWETAWLEQFSPQRPTLIGRLAKGDWGVVDLEVNADGEFAVSVDESGLMLVWNLATGQPVRSLIQGRSRTKPEQSVHHYLSREQDSSVADWGSCYVDVEWIDDRRIASASLDGSGTVFDVTTGEQLLVFSANEALYSVAAGLDQLLFGDAVGGLSLRSHDGKEVTALKTENGATTDLHWLAGHGRWLAGFENGKVVLLDAQSLEVLSELRVAAPVWSIDAIEKGTDALVVVGGNSSIPELARVTANGLEITERLEPPLSAEGSDALHQVSFAQGGKIILGGNGRGYLTQWDIESKVPSWTARVAGRDPRNRRVERLVTEQTGEPLPIIFDRRIAAIREVSNGGPIITAGEDLTIKIWDTPQDRDRSGMAVRLTQKVGKHPDIAFDSTREGRLWGIGEDGILHLLDVKLDRTVATRRAHVGGIVGMAIAKGSDIVATVGGDNHIRLWRAGEDTIVGAGIGSIDHSATLISVAVTENGEFVAAVDADARLGVWRINDGEQVFLTELKASIHQGRDTGISHPLTGRVAFNRDGSLLAAFGIGQSGYLFAAAPYRRLPMQMRIAGAGGTALLWNPRHRDVVFAADNHPRYATTAVDRDLRYLEEQPVVARQSCMAMEATSDSRRIVCLEKGGRVVFMETERHFQLLEFTHPRGLDSDLSLDASGKRLALAGQGGAVEILQIHAAEDTRISHRDDRSERWVMRDLVSPTALIPRADGRSIAFDSRGRLNMLLTLSRSQDFQLEGELHFLRSDGTSLVRERLIVDGTVNDRRFELQSTDLAIAPNDEPMIVFRRRTAVQNDYDGCFYSARRAGSDDWEFSIIHSHGNLGFYPILTLSPNGRVVEVLHFDFDGYKLCRSFPNGTELEHWDLEYLGRVGDGFRMQHARSDDESIHSLFSWNPVNGLQTPRIYSRYAKGKYTREIVDPFSAIDNPRVGPDGSVFVKARKATRTYVLQRGKKGWQEHSELPKGTGSFEVLSNGEMYFGPQWDADAGEILLWHKAGDDWNLEVIAAGLFALEPSWLQLLLDDRDRPAVMFGRLGEPNGWIKLLTVR